MDAQTHAFVEKEFVGRLDHDAGAVAGIVLAAAGAAVFHVLEDGQCVGDDLVGFVAFDIDDKPDTAGIAFKLRRV